MGLAERFKNRLEQRDIFTKNEVTKPIVDIHKKSEIKPVANILNPEKKETSNYQFEDLESKIIDKIRRTPYWKEYSVQKQERMIDLYLAKKGKSGNKITSSQKEELINNVMILSGIKQ